MPRAKASAPSVLSVICSCHWHQKTILEEVLLRPSVVSRKEQSGCQREISQTDTRLKPACFCSQDWGATDLCPASSPPIPSHIYAPQLEFLERKETQPVKDCPSWGWPDGSVDKGLPGQAGKLECTSSEPTEKLGRNDRCL